MSAIYNLIESDESFRKKLLDSNLISLQECTDEENERFSALREAGDPLPKGIVTSEDSSTKFVRIVPEDLSPEDELNLFEYLQLKELSKIRGWVTFFGVLTVISLIVGLISVLVR